MHEIISVRPQVSISNRIFSKMFLLIIDTSKIANIPDMIINNFIILK